MSAGVMANECFQRNRRMMMALGFKTQNRKMSVSDNGRVDYVKHNDSEWL